MRPQSELEALLAEQVIAAGFSGLRFLRQSQRHMTEEFFGDDEKESCRYVNGADQTAKNTIPEAKSWMIARCSDSYEYTSPVGAFYRTASYCTTCMAMRTSGWRIAGTPITRVHPRTARRGHQPIAAFVWSAAASGGSLPVACARRGWTGLAPTAGMPTSVFDWVGCDELGLVLHLQIPTHFGQVFRIDAGRDSDLKPTTIPN
jgi:hypothetical protein